jgi:trimeric autotransporter adhesin
LKQLSKHLNFANAISCIALFVALSGAAYAAKTTLGNKAVKTKNLANGAVTAHKLAGGSVTSLKIAAEAVTGLKIAPGAVGATQIANGAVRSAQLGGGVVTDSKIKNGSVTSEKIQNNAVSENQISVNAVATGKIQNGAVTAAKLSPTFLPQLAKNVVYTTGTSKSNTTEATKSATAECPSGKQAIGGGAKVVGGDVLIALTASAPTVADIEGKRRAWTVTAEEASASGTEWSVEALAVCAEF